MDKDRSLFHYCNLSTFDSIISGNSIRLSDISKSNDSQELLWAKEICFSRINELKEKTTSELAHKALEIVLLFAGSFGCGPRFYKLALDDESSSSKLIREKLDSSISFVFCLSESRDMLSQWRGYADDGTGISIGFSKNYLRQINSRKQKCPYFSIPLFKVNYGKKPVVKLVDQNIDFVKLESLTEASQCSNFAYHTIKEINRFAPYFKDPAFKEEKEWRIVFTANRNDLFCEKSLLSSFDTFISDEFFGSFTLPSIGFRTTKNNIIPYMEIKIKNLNAAINQIIIGPRCQAGVDDLRNYLVYKGLLKSINDNSIKIMKSACPYR